MGMKLKDAIAHAQYKADQNPKCECGKEHQQLADWLRILERMLVGAAKMKRAQREGWYDHSVVCQWDVRQTTITSCNCGFSDVVSAAEDFKG